MPYSNLGNSFLLPRFLQALPTQADRREQEDMLALSTEWFPQHPEGELLMLYATSRELNAMAESMRRIER